MANVQQPIQGVQPIQQKASSKSSLYMIGCVIVLLLMTASGIGGAFIGSKYLSKNDDGTEENGNGTSTETTTTETQGDGTTYTEGTIKVTSPVSTQEVNGKIFVEGEASDILEELTVRVYDDDWNKIGEKTAALESGNTNTTKPWSIFLDVTQSPTSLTGHVRVFPTERGESSKLTQTINIRFQSVVTAGRLKLFAPLTHQMMQGQAVTFRGQMKDFLEGIMGVRLKNEKGEEIFKDTITASGDNYGKYAQFEKVVEYKVNLKYHGTRGSWELFDLDIEGEAGNVVLTVPVRFPEN